MNPQGELVGSALISNTLVCEVSRMLNQEDNEDINYSRRYRRHHRSRNSNKNITDLLSLIEAVVLHDRVYTLPAKITSDAERLVFRRKLIEFGVLEELDTSKSHEKIGNLIIDNLANIKDPVRVAGSASAMDTIIDFESSIKTQIEGYLLLSEEIEGHSEPQLNDGYDYFDGDTRIISQSSFDSMARQLIGWIEYHYSGAYENCTSVLRDMYYIYSSEYFLLSYWPDSSRINFARQFPNYLDNNQSLRKQLYEKLAQSLKTTINDVFDDLKEEVVYIPPFSALVLDRSSSTNDIIDNTLNLRDEYTKLRKQFINLENERLAAVSIRQRKEIRKRQRMLLENAASVFDRPHKLSLEGIVRYIPELAKPVTSPLDPTKYSANLILQPVEWIGNWWRNRKISMIFHLADRVAEVKGYENLLQKV